MGIGQKELNGHFRKKDEFLTLGDRLTRHKSV